MEEYTFIGRGSSPANNLNPEPLEPVSSENPGRQRIRPFVRARGDGSNLLEGPLNYLAYGGDQHRDRYMVERPLDYLRSATARSVEKVVGSTGDLTSLAMLLPNYLSGGAIPSYEELQEKLPISLPTSQQIRERGIKKADGGLEPKSGLEDYFGEGISTIASMMAGGGAFGKLRQLPFKDLMKYVGKSLAPRAFGGVAAAKGAEALGAGPVVQTITKLGVMMAPWGAKKELVAQGERAYSQGKPAASKYDIDVKSAVKKLESLKDEHGTASAGKFITDRIDNFVNLVKNGKMNVKKLWDEKRNLNSWFKGAPEDAKPLLKVVNGIMRGPLEQAAKRYPKFGKYYEEAEDIAKGLGKAGKITNFLTGMRDKAINIVKNPISKILLFKNPAMAAKGLAGYTGINEIIGLSKIGDLLKNSSNARYQYKQLLISSAKESVPATLHHLAKFDEAANEYFSEEDFLPPGQQDQEEYTFIGSGK